MIQREREDKASGKVSCETAYDILSNAEMTAAKLQNIARRHWGIENSLHWVLDVTFCEDHYNAGKLNAAHNLAIVRHMPLDLLKTETKSHSAQLPISCSCLNSRP